MTEPAPQLKGAARQAHITAARLDRQHREIDTLHRANVARGTELAELRTELARLSRAAESHAEPVLTGTPPMTWRERALAREAREAARSVILDAPPADPYRAETLWTLRGGKPYRTDNPGPEQLARPAPVTHTSVPALGIEPTADTRDYRPILER